MCQGRLRTACVARIEPDVLGRLGGHEEISSRRGCAVLNRRISRVDEPHDWQLGGNLGRIDPLGGQVGDVVANEHRSWIGRQKAHRDVAKPNPVDVPAVEPVGGQPAEHQGLGISFDDLLVGDFGQDPVFLAAAFVLEPKILQRDVLDAVARNAGDRRLE